MNLKDENGLTALLFAGAKDRIDIVKLLLESGADINVKQGIALVEAERHGYTKLAKLLINSGADVNTKIDGLTPLMIAANKGLCDVVKALIEKGADVNAKSNEGKTAKMYAEKEGHIDIVELLKEARAKE